MKPRRPSRTLGAKCREDGGRLYGDVDRHGVAVEWHDFRTERSLDWGLSFHPRSVEFCLNLEGRGAVGDRAQVDYVPGSAGYYALTDEPLQASRRARDHHQFVTLEFSREHLQKQLADAKRISSRKFVPRFFPGKSARCFHARPMSAEQQTWSRPCSSRRSRKPPKVCGTRARRWN